LPPIKAANGNKFRTINTTAQKPIWNIPAAADVRFSPFPDPGVVSVRFESAKAQK
jgi:hypothetical protein